LGEWLDCSAVRVHFHKVTSYAHLANFHDEEEALLSSAKISIIQEYKNKKLKSKDKKLLYLLKMTLFRASGMLVLVSD